MNENLLLDLPKELLEVIVIHAVDEQNEWSKKRDILYALRSSCKALHRVCQDVPLAVKYYADITQREKLKRIFRSPTLHVLPGFRQK
jgi:hypothetical protein